MVNGRITRASVFQSVTGRGLKTSDPSRDIAAVEERKRRAAVLEARIIARKQGLIALAQRRMLVQRVKTREAVRRASLTRRQRFREDFLKAQRFAKTVKRVGGRVGRATGVTSRPGPRKRRVVKRRKTSRRRNSGGFGITF